MLLIDREQRQNHTAMILRPNDDEILVCRMNPFDVQQSKRLARKLQPYHGLENYSRMQFERCWFPEFKADLNIPARLYVGSNTNACDRPINGSTDCPDILPPATNSPIRALAVFLGQR